MQINKIQNQTSFQSGNYAFTKAAQNAGKNVRKVAKSKTTLSPNPIIMSKSTEKLPIAIQRLLSKLSTQDPFAGIL